MSAHKKPAQSIADMLANKIEKNNPGQRAFLRGYVIYSKKEIEDIATKISTDIATEVSEVVSAETTNKIIDIRVIPLIHRTAPERVDNYLYSIKYQKYDYEEGYQIMSEFFEPREGEEFNNRSLNLKSNLKVGDCSPSPLGGCSPSPLGGCSPSLLGGCSEIRKGDLVGRSYDYLKNQIASFVMTTTATDGRFATLGTAYGVDNLTKDIVDSGENVRGYFNLPFFMVDVVNENGVYIGINILTPGQYGYTTGTHYGEEGYQRICALMLPRYLADYAKSAGDAIDIINNKLDVYAPLHDMNEEVHLMICDENESFIVEFINNEVKVMKVGNGSYSEEEKYNHDAVMTNFYNYNWNGEYKAVYKGNTKEEVENTGLAPYAMGMERHEILHDRYNGIDSVESMWEAVKDVQYTKLYHKDITSPYWFSEFVGDNGRYGVLNIYNTTHDYDGVVDYAIQRYHEGGDNDYWLSVTANVYDIKNKKMQIISHENYDRVFKFNLTNDYNVEEEKFKEYFDDNFQKRVSEDNFKQYVAKVDEDEGDTLVILNGEFVIE